MWSCTRPGVPTMMALPATERVFLLLHRGAAVDGCHRDVPVLGERFELAGHLQGQLARRAEDSAFTSRVPMGMLLDEGHAERGRLAGARLGADDEVLAVHRAGLKAWACTGVGVVYPRSATARRSSGDRPRSSKAMSET